MVLAKNGQGGADRIEWVDYAKGFCIVFVVMMHATLGVGEAAGREGFMHHVVEFARPFRMPDFFMIAGLFLALVIDRPWKSYLDKKVLHFAYFYLIWTFIQFGVKIPVYGAEYGYDALPFLYLSTLWEPFSTLWFIYMLPVMFVVTKLLRSIPWPIVLAGAAILQIAPIHTGNLIVDEFASRYVYFLAGYLFAAHIFQLAEAARQRWGLAVIGLLVWCVVNGVLVFTPTTFLGETIKLADLPVVSLALGVAGAAGVILASALLAKVRFMEFLRVCGQHSIVVYLAFFFPMAVSRIILLKLGIIDDIGVISLIVTATAVIAPLILYFVIKKIGFGLFLFERPAFARLDTGTRPDKARLQAAE
ncbi:MAG: acyltransferase family protein [Pseudomonadota bacterium]